MIASTWKPTAKMATKSILKRLRASSIRNKKITHQAVEDTISTFLLPSVSCFFSAPLFFFNFFISSFNAISLTFIFFINSEYMTNDCADGLREHGKYKITNFGKFQVSQRTGKIEFTPYTAFLDRMENEETNDEDEDDNN